MAEPQNNYAIVTNAGLTKHAAVGGSGAELVLTHIAFGDAERVPTGAEVALGNELIRYGITSHGLVPGTPSEMYFEVLVPEEAGPFTIRESGLFDEDGVLIAVAREGTPINKVTPASGRSHSFTYRIQVAFSRTDNVTIEVAPGSYAYAPYERRIDTGFGLTGGGDLSADRTLALDTEALDDRYLGSNAVVEGTGLDVTDDGEGNITVDIDFADEAETIAGELTVKAVHPAGLASALTENQTSIENRTTRLFARVGL